MDFDGSNEAGHLLLTGPTGAGKSTVLDAISFAIYGRVPRSRGSPSRSADHLALKSGTGSCSKRRSARAD
ncbi:MAG: AAA family ATPase [Solirubrobacterales bacterium]|nr:AAA family ATPase [Solirubrobacterales bacterium]